MSAPDPQLDLILLRRFEPVLRYTRGERFFPMDVERYITQCSLWVQPEDGPAQLLVPQRELSIEKLIEPRQAPFGSVYFLKFIEPLDLGELAKQSINEAVTSIRKALKAGLHDLGDRFRAGRGRLARVGYGSRFVDALFSLTLMLRGRVPGDTALAAGIVYRSLQKEEERYCYYGRVVRDNGWVILQYWYFYPFNNWRSGFFGVNDHEADWEMVCIYCSEKDATGDAIPPEDRLTPEWVAYASHDFSGDDLRRRWDDAEVEKVADARGNPHPVVYAGAGSHASYFNRGEYLAELELPFLSPLVRLMDLIQNIWVKVLRQATRAGQATDFNYFRIPFVDYARGDGLSIGPGQKKEWEPGYLDERTPWAVDFRGLWGLYAQDPISGENAPAGPVYNRDGLVRRSWYDPLGWAGLDKVPPPDEMRSILTQRRQEIEASRVKIRDEIASKSAILQQLGVEAAALQAAPHLVQAHTRVVEQIIGISAEVQELRGQLALDGARLDALELHGERLDAGDRGPMRAHIHRAHRPSLESDFPLASVAEFVAAVSIGVLMVGVVLLVVFARQYLVIGLAALIGVLIFVEAGFRRQLPRLINSLTVGLAVVSALVLTFEFFWQIVVVAVISAGVFIMWENLREITR